MAAPYTPVTIDASISGSTNPDIVLWGGMLYVFLKMIEERTNADSAGSWAATVEPALIALGVPTTAAAIVAVNKVEELHTALPIVLANYAQWPAIVN